MSANLSAVPKLQFFDNNGNPLVGGKLYTYAAGTTTPLATYTDASAVTPNTNPIILDSRGEANVWLSATTYKFILKDSTDATIWTVDNISNSLSLSQILAASGSAANPPYTFASDTDTGMYLAAVGQLGLTVGGSPVIRATSTDMVLSTSGLDRVAIGSSGNVGIGTTSPGNRLQVSSPLTGTTPRSNTVARIQSEATGRDVNIQLSDNITNSAEVGMVSGNLYFATSGSERMRIDTSGNVGIGTASPAYTLDINKASADFRVRNASAGNDFVVRSIAGPVTVIGCMSNTPLAITTNDITRIHVTSTGNVGIGTISPNSLFVVSNGGAAGVEIIPSTGEILTFNRSTSLYTNMTFTSNVMTFRTGGATDRMRIAADGSQSSVIPSGSTLYPQFACRAWINFDGTSGSIGTGRGSGNVSSVTDNGTGNYTINFSTAMPDVNYAVTGTANGRNTHPARVVGAGYSGDTFSTSAVQIRTGTAGGSGANGTTEDCEYVFVAIFR